MKNILRCPSCGKYTMKKSCSCGNSAVSPKPPKFSPEDKYSGYRRRVKKEVLKEKGLL